MRPVRCGGMCAFHAFPKVEHFQARRAQKTVDISLPAESGRNSEGDLETLSNIFCLAPGIACMAQNLT